MLREQEKELRETEEKRTRLVKEVWTGSHDIYSQACPAARTGWISRSSPQNFLLELRRQAIADLSKLNDSRVRSQAMVTLYGSFRFSASTEAKRFRNMVASLLAPPDAEKTSGVKAALSTEN